MNGRVVTAIIGIITLLFGIVGLVYPDRVLFWVGLDLLSTNRQAGLVEARAIYGGLFLVLGVFTLWASMSPRAHRGELLLIAFLWLGAFAGRMVGVSIEGSPGLLNTLVAIFELIVGGLLLAAPYLGGAEEVPPQEAPPQPVATP
jgi:hypothetical protein